jgi:sugar phosphate isomerase/epimerase
VLYDDGMIKPAFSTVACPDWTLHQAAEAAELSGFMGVELRTFGSGSTSWACDPFLSDQSKTRAMFERAGAEVCSLGTSVRFDPMVTPPIIGEVFFDHDAPIRAVRECVELAAQLECPFVRVFGFEVPALDTRPRALRRIGERLDLALTAARNTGVRLALENGGSFNTAADLIELIDARRNALLVASYSVPAAVRAGEDPVAGVRALGERLAIVKLKDFKDAKPCPLGEGEMPVDAVLAALRDSGFAGWVVYEYDRAWIPAEQRSGLPTTAQMLTMAAERMYRFAGRRAAGVSGRGSVARV